MKAVFETGGKQYYVEEKDLIYVEKLNLEDGKTIKFDKVLFVNGTPGTPYVKGATVECKVVKSGKAKKIKVFKFKKRKNYRRNKGHRQPYTLLSVEKINL